jgi:hypothetical protein
MAPIALYPDSLLAQITTAATNPQEILDFDNWLAQNRNMTLSQLTAAAEQQGFDPAFIALAGFPDVVEMMAENIDDYAAIGSAVLANQDIVSQSIQRLRAQAYNSGVLRSTPQQQVEVQPGPYYVITPVNPNVVYVPQYDPTVVYAGSGLNAGLITFGIGIGITALLVSRPWGWGGWGWNWGSRRIYYNRGPWGGWGGGYRPPRPWYRPRPIQWSHRPGYGGNWGYRPPNYRPPRPIYRPQPTRPGVRPPSHNRPIGGPKPPTIQPIRPGNPGGRPPGNNRPPTIQPVKPGGPGNPGNRPRPTGSTRPAPQPRPQPQQPRPQGQRPAAAPRPQPQNRPQNQPRPQNQQRPQGGDQRNPR